MDGGEGGKGDERLGVGLRRRGKERVGQEVVEEREGRKGRAVDGQGGGKGERRMMPRECLVEAEDQRMSRVRESAAAAGMKIGGRLRKIQGEHMFHRWRWGRVPMEGGGWLVTFQHDPVAEWEAEEGERGGGMVELHIVGAEREVRHAVMESQFGWGVYAVCECRGLTQSLAKGAV